VLEEEASHPLVASRSRLGETSEFGHTISELGRNSSTTRMLRGNAVKRFATQLVVCGVLFIGAVATSEVSAAPASMAKANHTYEAKIRRAGNVSTTQVQASDAGPAKKLVQAQYGSKVTVLSVKRVD
jgi:hypothetical protein